MMDLNNNYRKPEHPSDPDQPAFPQQMPGENPGRNIISCYIRICVGDSNVYSYSELLNMFLN